MEGHITSACILYLLLAFAMASSPALGATHPTTKNPATTTTAFIRSRCTATEYPRLCVASLSSYAPAIGDSPEQLAHAALAVSLQSARSAAAAATKLLSSPAVGGGGRRASAKEAAAVADCVEGLGDSVRYLKDSLEEMGHLELEGKNARLRIDDVQTWVSTALTDESACTDGMGEEARRAAAAEGGALRAVRGRVVNVARLTSNALALVAALAKVG